jgi:hypothetical protein
MDRFVSPVMWNWLTQRAMFFKQNKAFPFAAAGYQRGCRFVMDLIRGRFSQLCALNKAAEKFTVLKKLYSEKPDFISRFEIFISQTSDFYS